LIAGVLIIGAAPAGAQVVTEMTPELVRQAIADTKAKGCYPLESGGVMGTAAKFWRACFTTPYSRVVYAASEARARYQTFTEKQVTPEMVAPEVEIVASPQKSFVDGRGMVGVPTSVIAVVVIPQNSKDRSQAILPTRQEANRTRYMNLFGATWEADGMVAYFPLSVLNEKHEVRFVYENVGCQDWKGKLTTECGVQIKLKGVR
jgi:hypothetical protein